jgi:DNA-directed RNA polymerase subunit N (RpoN/RPB10)
MKQLCNCGCGYEVTKKGNKYIHGHNHKGKTYEDIYEDLAFEKKEKRRIIMTGRIREDMTGDKNIAKNPIIREKIKEGVKKVGKKKIVWIEKKNS